MSTAMLSELMAAFLLLASDIRIGADGPFRIGLNEVAIGIPVPTFGLELAPPCARRRGPQVWRTLNSSVA